MSRSAALPRVLDDSEDPELIDLIESWRYRGSPTDSENIDTHAILGVASVHPHCTQ